MHALFNSETLVAKRKNEWDSLFARISTYTDSKEHVYARKQNVQFTSLKHGFRKRFATRKKQTRPRKLAFEVKDLDNDESDTEVLSDDSSIYSANDELQSDISDSESVNSVQYVLQCNEQRKLPDFNTKVENCQTYMLQNACFNQGIKENNPNVSFNNSSVNKKALQTEKNNVNEVSSFLEEEIPTHCSALKSLFADKNIEIRIINPVENEQILTTDQSQILNSENKQLKSILSTKISENSSKITKKITFSSDPDSEIDIEEFQSDDNVSIKGNDNETDHHTSQNSNLSTSENTKTLSTKDIAENNEVNLNHLNIQNVNNLEKAIYTTKTNEKPKIYSSAARKKRQLSVNTDTESRTSENTVDQISEVKIAKANTTLIQCLRISSKETHINNGNVAKLTENESLVKINQCNEQNAELRTNAIRKSPSKHKETSKNKCHIIFSTELDCSDNESSILNTNLKVNQCNEQNAELRTNAIRKTPSKHKETTKNQCNIFFSTELDCSDNESSISNKNLKINQSNEQYAELRSNAIRKTPLKHKETTKNQCNIFFSTELNCSDNESSISNTISTETFGKKEDTLKKKMSRIYLSSSSSESDSEECINIANIDLKSRIFVKGKNKENTIRKEDSKNITNKENQTVCKQVDSIKSNSQETPTIIVLTTPVKTINSASKLKSGTPKDICKKLFTNTRISTSLLREKTTANSEEEHNKENRLPKENTTRIKSKLNKNKEKIKQSKKIFSTETHCNESECNLTLKSKSNVLTKTKFDKNNFIRNITTQVKTTDDVETKKQYLISSTPNVNVIRAKSSQEQCLKEYNIDDEITELFSCDQSTILNEEHMNDVTQINIQKDVDENPSEDDEIFETTCKNKSRKLVEYTNNKKNIIDENTIVNDNYEDTSNTVVNLRHNKNEPKIITGSKKNGMLDISSSNEIANKALIKSSRKKKSRENILESPTLSTKSNSNNQSSKIVKCRQRLFNSSSEIDNDNPTIQFNSAVLAKESLETKQDEFNMDKENAEDLNRDNETHSLPETTDIISESVNEQNSILQNLKKRKLGDSNCGSVKQREKKHKKHCTEQVILNGTTENDVKLESKDSNNYNTTVNGNMTSQEHTNIAQSIKDEDNTKRNVSEKKNGKKRRGKCKKEIRFVLYSTDDYTNDEDKIWAISSMKNRTPLSLEYFLDDDVF